MPENKKKKLLLKGVNLLFTLVFIGVSYFLSYTYVGPKIEEAISNYVNRNINDPDSFIQKLPINKPKVEDRGLRTAKVTSGYQNIPKDIVREESYKDVRLISTSRRSFSEKEISLFKAIIDAMPQKIFDYRPWAIISTEFDNNDITKVNPEGVAFASGPYIFVSDVTFIKQDSFDTGTFRGLERILSHEFTHVMQFFHVETLPMDTNVNYLETTNLFKEWTLKHGWIKKDGEWILNKSEETTDYGKTSPIEDMADSFGSMIVGDEFAISESRRTWVLNWLGIKREELLIGTIPTASHLVQRKTDPEDSKFLEKYKDQKAIIQDIINFQSNKEMSIRDVAAFYNREFSARGWQGRINNSGIGEFIYDNKYRINLEIDRNPLRVITMVMSVY